MKGGIAWLLRRGPGLDGDIGADARRLAERQGERLRGPARGHRYSMTASERRSRR